MTRQRSRARKPGPALAERLAGMSIAEIDAMSDREIAELMGATAEEIASEPAWTWRDAAKVATSEYADRLIGDVESGRATVITDPAEIRRRLGGRPRVGGEPGEGPSAQVRVRVTTRTRAHIAGLATTVGLPMDAGISTWLTKFGPNMYGWSCRTASSSHTSPSAICSRRRAPPDSRSAVRTPGGWRLAE
jgi:hypothetical protein